MEIGIDEVGRGCLAGPVVSCSVYIPSGVDTTDFRDSKKISKKKREGLAQYIKETCIYGIGIVSPKIIDEINILNATFLSMKNSIDEVLEKSPSLAKGHFLVDGDRFPGHRNIEYSCVIKGDDKHKCISAASVLAKVERDRIMEKLSQEFPGYLWEKNAGYGTKDHSAGILNLGLTEHHRRTFCSKFI